MVKYAPRHGDALVKYAKSLVGRSYPVGWCQRFTNETFGTGSVGDWDGDRAADAEDGWKKASARGKVVPASQIRSYNDIPASVMMYWLGGSHDHGHAAVGIGGGRIVSTDLPTMGRIGNVPASLPHTRWGLTFAGYALVEGNGYTLTAAPTSPNYQPKHEQFEPGTFVVQANVLNGRQSPSLTAKVLYHRHRGDLIKVVKTATGSGISWYISDHGTAYASAYLKRK